MSNAPQTDKQAIRQTRDILGARLGEMITGLLGDDSLEKQYAGGAGPSEAAGAAAEKGGIVSAESKTALLIAQAAERTLRAAEKTAFIIAHRDEIAADLAQNIKDQQYDHGEAFRAKIKEEVDRKNPPTFLQRIFQSHAERYGLTREERFTLEREQRAIETKAYENKQTELGYVSPADTAFKYVGADGDPQALKSAQATMVAAQMYLNNEIESRLYKSAFPLDIGVSSVGADFIDGLKQKAADDLKIAGEMLEKDGHGAAAQRLGAVAASIGVSAAPAQAPDALVKEMYRNEEWNVAYSNQAMSMWTMASFGHRTGFDEDNCDRLMKLINPASSGLHEPAQTAKAGIAPAPKAAAP